MREFLNLSEMPVSQEIKAEIISIREDFLARGYVKLGDALKFDFERTVHLCFLMDKVWPGRLSPQLMRLVRLYHGEERASQSS